MALGGVHSPRADTTLSPHVGGLPDFTPTCDPPAMVVVNEGSLNDGGLQGTRTLTRIRAMDVRSQLRQKPMWQGFDLADLANSGLCPTRVWLSYHSLRLLSRVDLSGFEPLASCMPCKCAPVAPQAHGGSDENRTRCFNPVRVASKPSDNQPTHIRSLIRYHVSKLLILNTHEHEKRVGHPAYRSSLPFSRRSCAHQ